MPRLGYSKSRRGCLRCKERRVKCDESQPCAACSRHGIRCSLLHTAPSVEKPPTGRSASRMNMAKRKFIQKTVSPSHPVWLIRGLPPLAPATSSQSSDNKEPMASGLDNFPYFAKFVTGEPRHTLSNWTTDLELMHHYCTAASLSLPRGLELQPIWQSEIPKLALENHYLMHQILAISAYHQAYLRPQHRSHYAILSSQHQNDAVQGLRANLNKIDKDSCHAIFSAASLLSISAFACLSRSNNVKDGHPNLEDLLDTFLLIRGMSQVLLAYEQDIHGGPIGRFLQLGDHESMTPLLALLTERLRNLKIPRNGDIESQALCQAEAATLIKWIKHASETSAVPELRVALTWPIGLAEGYLKLLRIRHPAALDVLGFYCIILSSAGSMFWFIEGWGESVLQDASRKC